MSITFNTPALQGPIYVPGVYLEIAENTSQDTIATIPPKILLFGQMFGGSAAAAGIAMRVYSADQVGQLCGRGSMLHQMAVKSFLAAPFVPTFILPELDNAGGTKSSRTLSITGTATAAGTLPVHIGDRRYPIAVPVGATGASLATALAAAIQADTDRWMDAAVNGDTTTEVDLTARHKGIDAGAIPFAICRYDNEFIPAGLTVTPSALTAGATNPDFSAAITALGDAWYPQIACPYTDNTNLLALKTELMSRFDGVRMIPGSAFTGLTDTVANEIAFATGRNDYTLDGIDCNDCLTPPIAVAASVAAIYANRPNPGRAVQRVTMPGVLSVARTNRRKWSDRQDLLAGGVSTLTGNDDGSVMIERLTTTYRTNPTYGTADNHFLDQETVAIETNIRFSTWIRFTQKYPDWWMGQNGSEGDDVMTPSVAIGEYVSLYKGWKANSWVEGGDAETQFYATMQAIIDSDDPDRMNTTASPNTMNFCRVIAGQIQFIR
jgi:phage tail sheath gpL-like